MKSENEALRRQLGATAKTPPPLQPGLQAEVDKLRSQLESVETQEEPRLRAEVDELRRQLELGGAADTENDELRRQLRAMEKRALATSSLGGSFASSVSLSSERGASSIAQAIIIKGSLQKKSKYFGSWQERSVTLDVAGNFTWDGGGSHRNFVSLTAKTSVTLGVGEDGRWEFSLVSDGKKILLAAKEEREREEWVGAVKGFCES